MLSVNFTTLFLSLKTNTQYPYSPVELPLNLPVPSRVNFGALLVECYMFFLISLHSRLHYLIDIQLNSYFWVVGNITILYESISLKLPY